MNKLAQRAVAFDFPPLLFAHSTDNGHQTSPTGSAILQIGLLFLALACLAATPVKADTTAAADQANPVPAVDISFWSGNISGSEVACWRDNGIRHVVAGTQNPQIARQQLETAVTGGMTVDAYVVLYWDFDIANQVQAALATINGLPVQRLWLDVEKPRGNWSATQLIHKIEQGVSACGPMPCGIYTRKVWWRDNVANTSAFSNLPIWYAYYDGQSEFEDWYGPLFWYEGPFGGWSDPTGKQFDSDWTAPDLCGVNVDYNVMYVNGVGSPSPDVPAVPPAPTELAPDDATITTSAVSLSVAAITDATLYEFVIEYGDGFNWQYYYTYSSTDNAQTFWPAFDGTQYRWRVRAQNAYGWGEWSTWATFNFGNAAVPPPAPTGLVPNDATITTNSVTLGVEAITDATRYEFAIEYWDGLAWRYYYAYAPGGNAQTFWPVFADTQYRWRARAQNAYGWGEWSAYAMFNYGNVPIPPPAPTGLVPDGSTITTSAVSLSVEAIAHATRYEFQIY
ncbi:MAG: GH25 family lysozyme, partial [Acidiferrobacterales bacterium]